MTAWDLFFRDVRAGALSHAYLVTGAENAALSAFCRRAAAAAVCTAADGKKPCGTCLDCRKAAGGTHPDLYEIPPAGEKILVEHIAALVESCYVKPLESERKAYILHRFDEANEKAQNKLLKILEEPVKNTVFFLAASAARAVLPTVQSRCKKLTVEEDPAAFLREVGSEGQMILEYIADLYKNMRGSADILRYAVIFARFRDRAAELLTFWELYTRDMILYKAGRGEILLNTSRKSDIIAGAAEFSIPALTAVLGHIAAARRLLKVNVNLTPMLDNLLYAILNEKHKSPV